MCSSTHAAGSSRWASAQPVATTSSYLLLAPASLGEDPPHRPPFADRVDDGGAVLHGHARTQNVVNGDVGPFQWILGRQHMGGQLRGLVVDDLGGGEHFEALKGRYQLLRLGKAGHQAAADVDQRADVSRPDGAGNIRALIN